MNEEPFILDFDLNKKAVIEPGVENLEYKFILNSFQFTH